MRSSKTSCRTVASVVRKATESAVSNEAEKNKRRDTRRRPLSLLRQFTLLTPLWTVVAAAVGISHASTLGPLLGSVPTVSKSLFILMFAMACSTTPTALRRAVQSPGILATNTLCCFGLMPLLAVCTARILQCDASLTAGTVLLGSVCGGQASNLFTLLAGGDVSLSVICTLSTTLLGVVATPLLVKTILGGSVVAVDGLAVLISVVSLVLGPLVLGLTAMRLAPPLVAKQLAKMCPLVGIGATLLLVMGGAANSAAAVHWSSTKAVLASILLPALGGVTAAVMTHKRWTATARRAVVVEVLSKSPTLAYVLALKHFDATAATVPAAAMVSLDCSIISSWGLFVLLFVCVHGHCCDFAPTQFLLYS